MTPDPTTQRRKQPRPRAAAPATQKGLFDSARAHPRLVLIPLVALCALAIVIAFLRPATYTAEAELAVGRINVSTVAAPGVVSASQSLASAYSRAISADAVSKEVKAKLGESPGETAASPIPESPVILIEGKASSEEDAVKLANTASRALIKYVNELNSTKDETEELLSEYEEVQEEIATLGGSATPDDAAKLSALRLRLHSIEAAYRTNLEEATTGNDLRVLTSAQGASSDRKSVLKLLLFAAVVAGLGIGLLLAYRRANMRSAKPVGKKLQA
jgi:capsular polysaccharide biosynthesis protein